MASIPWHRLFLPGFLPHVEEFLMTAGAPFARIDHLLARLRDAGAAR